MIVRAKTRFLIAGHAPTDRLYKVVSRISFNYHSPDLVLKAFLNNDVYITFDYLNGNPRQSLGLHEVQDVKVCRAK